MKWVRFKPCREKEVRRLSGHVLHTQRPSFFWWQGQGQTGCHLKVPGDIQSTCILACRDKRSFRYGMVLHASSLWQNSYIKD